MGVVLLLLSLCIREGVSQAVCQGITCASSNTVCNAENKCDCATGFVGNGRTLCTTGRCVCSSVGDPHFDLFDSANPDVKVNLVCTFAMALPATNAQCLAAAFYLETAPDSNTAQGDNAFFRVFASKIKGIVVSSMFRFTTAEADNAGSRITSTTTTGATTGSSDGFNTVTFSDCGGYTIGFKDPYGLSYFSGPATAGTYTLNSMCGDCDGTADENPGTTEESRLCYAIQRLAPPDLQQAMPYNSQCGITQTVMSSCAAGDITDACAICVPYLTESLGKCLVITTSALTHPQLMTRFQECVQKVCGDATNSVTQDKNGACATLVSDIGASCTYPKPSVCP